MKGVTIKDYFRKFKTLFFSQSKFFKSVEKEKDYRKILFFYVTIAVISIVVSLIPTFIQLIFRPELLQDELLSQRSTYGKALLILFDSLFKITLSFLIPFVIAGITHLGILIFKGKQGFLNTFKPITYAATIGFAYNILASLIQIPFIFYLPVIPKDISLEAMLLLVKTNKVLIFSVVTSIAISLISFIHVLTASILGISKFQKMGRWKSFFAIIIIPLILLLLLFLSFAPLLALFKSYGP